MKLLVFCYEYPPVGGGAANALFHLVREWAVLGHRIVVVTSHYRGLPLREDGPGLTIVRIPVGRKRVYSSGVIEMARYMAGSLRMADRLCDAERPDVCVAFFAVPGGPAPLYLHARRRVPFVIELRGGDVPGFDPGRMRFLHFLTRPLVRRLLARCSLAVANSGGLKRLALECRPGTDIRVIPNGVDPVAFFPVQKPGCSAVLNLIFVGRLVETQKNITLLFGAVSKITGSRLVVVGDGPDRPRLERLGESLGISDRLVFTGWLKGDALVKAYRGADVFVSASRWEGMPNVVLEAMACGLPLALSRCPGNEDLVVEKKNGFLFFSGDRDHLVRILRELASDPDRRSAMGAESRRIAVERHSWKRLAADHLKVFEEAVKKQAAILPPGSGGRRGSS